ncbi:MAG: hypothetical protein QOC64_2623 [Solirubrobacteraceae bacterium]|jgi:beta-lactamase superfamily II metal-dependent hydrolase|nr:hypothetical protein [Solirubrobacteraceae bacterium]
MKLTVFQSDKGDCLLVQGAAGEHILVDGGMASSYRAHVAPTLAALREQGTPLDLLYVSHIDEDHIEGVLALMQAEVEWRVHEHQVAHKNPDHPEPKELRPPEVRELWHNAFDEVVGNNSRPIAEMLAATAAVLDAGDDPDDPALAERQRDLGSSVDQGIRLSRRAGADQLKIPLNRAFDGKLALVRDDQQPIELGSLKLTVIGPFEEDLKELRKEWNEWLKANKRQLADTQRHMREDAERLGTSEFDLLQGELALQAAALGNRKKVTAPNLASLMLLLEEGTKQVLLTGDGHADDILRGLEHAGRLDADGAIHVDVLKVQHHGAEFNIDEEFCRRVTADRYVFCANGAHANPDLRALQAILDSRLGAQGVASDNAQAGDRFELLFNSRSTVVKAGPRREHMEKVEALVVDAQGRHPNRFEAAFLDDHLFELQV